MFFSFLVLTSECNDGAPITSWECGLSLGRATPHFSHDDLQPQETLDSIPLEEECSDKY